MKNKGFTLVEILGVMTLLAIIFALIYPNVMNMMEKGKQNDYENYKNSVFLATEAYVNSNAALSTQLNAVDTSVNVTYSQLLQSGFLSPKVVNPKTGESVSSLTDTKVKVTVTSDKTFTYSIIE